MRFARSVLLALLTLTCAAAPALADATYFGGGPATASVNGAAGVTSSPGEARNFGSVTCRETFNCSSPDQVITNVATSCSAGNLGHPADFDMSIMDANSCMTSDPAGNGGKGGSYVTCCLKPARQDGMCRMTCSLMVAGPGN